MPLGHFASHHAPDAHLEEFFVRKLELEVAFEERQIRFRIVVRSLLSVARRRRIDAQQKRIEIPRTRVVLDHDVGTRQNFANNKWKAVQCTSHEVFKQVTRKPERHSMVTRIDADRSGKVGIGLRKPTQPILARRKMKVVSGVARSIGSKPLQKLEAILEPTEFEKYSRLLAHGEAAVGIDRQGLVEKLECVAQPSIFGSKHGFPLVEDRTLRKNLPRASELRTRPVESTVVKKRFYIGEKIFDSLEPLDHENIACNGQIRPLDKNCVGLYDVVLFTLSAETKRGSRKGLCT